MILKDFLRQYPAEMYYICGQTGFICVVKPEEALEHIKYWSRKMRKRMRADLMAEQAKSGKIDKKAIEAAIRKITPYEKRKVLESYRRITGGTAVVIEHEYLKAPCWITGVWDRAEYIELLRQQKGWKANAAIRETILSEKGNEK